MRLVVGYFAYGATTRLLWDRRPPYSQAIAAACCVAAHKSLLLLAFVVLEVDDVTVLHEVLAALHAQLASRTAPSLGVAVCNNTTAQNHRLASAGEGGEGSAHGVCVHALDLKSL